MARDRGRRAGDGTKASYLVLSRRDEARVYVCVCVLLVDAAEGEGMIP